MIRTTLVSRRLNRFVTVLVGALVAVSIASQPAAAVQQHGFGAANVSWQVDGPGDDLWNVDQEVTIERAAPSSYWALQFTFSGSAEGGYIGLQKDGIRVDGSIGDTGVFALWGATGSRGAPGACGTFAGEGTGHSCRIALPLIEGAYYRYRIWRLQREGDEQWWGAWIYSSHSGVDQYLGAIRVPAENHQLMGSLLNFSEYWGSAKPCDQVPVSTVFFTQPAGNSRGVGTGAYQYYSRYRRGSFFRLACTGGRVAEAASATTQGVRLTLGGP